VVSVWSIAAGFGLSFTVGLLAGVLPARNAARLDPIAALRND
jgi:putative ABC transport system permease protein